MATFAQRIERGLKTTSVRFLRANALFKRKFARRANCVFVTAMPRSGSSYLTKCLAELTGFIPFFLGYHHHNEQDLYLPKLIDSYTIDIVAHQHTRATEATLVLMRNFLIKPVILVRSLPDALVSLCDHLSMESHASPLFAPPSGFRALPYDKRLEIVVDIALPWYIRFYAGWEQAVGQGRVDALWITYEEITRDAVTAIGRIFEFYGLLRPSDNRIQSIVHAFFMHPDTRFNIGRPGRGLENLTQHQVERIQRMLDHCRLLLSKARFMHTVLPSETLQKVSTN